MAGGSGAIDAGKDKAGGPTLSSPRKYWLLQLARIKYYVLVCRWEMERTSPVLGEIGLVSSTAIPPAMARSIVDGRVTTVATTADPESPDANTVGSSCDEEVEFVAGTTRLDHDSDSGLWAASNTGDWDHCNRNLMMGYGGNGSGACSSTRREVKDSWSRDTRGASPLQRQATGHHRLQRKRQLSQGPRTCFRRLLLLGAYVRTTIPSPQRWNSWQGRSAQTHSEDSQPLQQRPPYAPQRPH